jgi:hypothetical protein
MLAQPIVLSFLAMLPSPALVQEDGGTEIGWFEDICLDDRLQACARPDKSPDFGWFREMTNSRSAVEKGMKESLRQAKREGRPILLMGGDYC